MPEFNWDAISAITEVVGVIVVVASLVYVGRQIAQNNQIMRVSAASETLEREFDLVYPVIDDPEFTEIWIKGNDRFEDLSEVEQHRLLFAERQFGIGNNRHGDPLLRQPEHMLGHDVCLHLAGAAADSGGEAVEIGPLPESARRGIGITHIEAAAGALHVDRELAHASRVLCGPVF